ncbi:hypothetical protein ATANTOWER_010528 [Ataeniobius toweri]|uniref:Uncharacterized protein n=1 Tax=Ataeniobius toweri TaxID=208326 RepID=A0ABU7AA25_9TELE|nr:hypothetical protein [Ataeniobius toweri]
MSLDCGRKWSTQREPTHTLGEYANSMQKDLRLGFEPRTFLPQGNSVTNCATEQRTNVNRGSLWLSRTRSSIPVLDQPTADGFFSDGPAHQTNNTLRSAEQQTSWGENPSEEQM